MARANPGQLGTTAYIVLGLVDQFGTASPYDVISFGQRSVGHFWDFHRSQVYDEVDRLVERKLLSETRETTGRRRRLLQLTDEGREALTSWAKTPVDAPVHVRHEGLLKLFFSGLVDARAVDEAVTQQLAATRDRLAELESLAELFDADHPDADAEHRDSSIRLVLEAGIRIDRALVAYWQDVLARRDASSRMPTSEHSV